MTYAGRYDNDLFPNKFIQLTAFPSCSRCFFLRTNLLSLSLASFLRLPTALGPAQIWFTIPALVAACCDLLSSLRICSAKSSSRSGCSSDHTGKSIVNVPQLTSIVCPVSTCGRPCIESKMRLQAFLICFRHLRVNVR